MANLTKTEKYVALTYAKYFGKTADKGTIEYYGSIGKTSKILKQIIKDADIEQYKVHGDDLQAEVHKTFQNLFSRNADNKELQKYVKVLQKGKNLPINSIVKKATKFDKDVYEAKQAVALLIAEKGSTTNIDLDKITKYTYEDVYDLKAKKVKVDSVEELKTKIDAMPDNVSGTTFTLTASADELVGKEKGDVFNAYDFMTPTGTMKSTLTSIDSLDGGEGKDTLNVKSDNAIEAVSATVKSIETINLESGSTIGAAGAFDTTTFTGVETLNVKKATAATLKAAATTDVNVSGATSTVDVDGGKNVTVTDAKAAVVLDNAKGNVTVTDATQTADITINDGANVTVTATSDATAKITIGGTNTIVAGTDINSGNATGDVVVTSNLNGADKANLAGGDITVTGGKTVNVTVNATSAETTADGTVSSTTQGEIKVTADNTTTSVTVKQTASVTGSDAVTAVAGVNEVSTIKFVTLANNGTVTIDGLTFTNTSGAPLSAADVAAAFANLTAGEIQGCSTKGTYSGAWAGNWTSSAVATDTVTFTAVAQSTTSDISTGASIGGATLAVVTAGKTAVTADAGKGTIATGVVTILDNATASITTVSVDGYKNNSKIGVNGASTAASLNALTDLTLANGDIGADIDVATTATSLNLTLNNITSVAGGDQAKINLDHNGNVTADGSKTIKTLNITTAGKDSDVEITAAAVETLTVSGTNALDLTASTLTALKTVTVSGTAGLTINASGTNVTSVTTTATTGAVTATIDAEKATYTGGAGVDTVTLSNNDIDKAISLGAGDDKLTLATGTKLADITVTVDGGAGDADTLVMDAVDAQDASASNAFDLKVINFERLSLTQVAVDNATASVSDVVTVDLSKLTYDYVITAGTTTGGDDMAQDQLLLQNMANNGTVVLNANGLVTVQVKDAGEVANTTDVLNVVVNTEDTLNAGALTVANVETINISTVDLDADELSDGAVTLDLNATSAKTVTVKGDADLTLGMTGNTAATLIDGSTMTGDLTVTSYNITAASTIKGGFGDDTLTAANANFVTTLIGGAGDDRLVDAGGFATLTGGEGNDTFVISNPAGTSLFDFTTITDASSGDRIEFAEFAVNNTVKFKATAVTLTNPNGATLQDYANKAISTTDTGDISWFTFGGDSYLVVNQSNNALSFNNSTDTIVKLTGVTDLNASFNNSATTEAFIEIC